MPREMRDVDWERDRGGLEGGLVDDDDDADEGGDEDGEGDGDGGRLLVTETPFLQALMAAQIRRDLHAGMSMFMLVEIVDRSGHVGII